MKISDVCRYCGGKVELVSAEVIYGNSTARLGLENESIYLCRTCNARVGCHRGSTRPLGNLANEVLRLKRMETHQVFDAFWKAKGMTRTAAYRWLAQSLCISDKRAHIGSFEMDTCEQVIRMCRDAENELEAA